MSAELIMDATLKAFLDETKSSSDRTRYVIIVIAIVGILCIFAVWNRSDVSWFDARVEFIDARISCLETLGNPSAPKPQTGAYCERLLASVATPDAAKQRVALLNEERTNLKKIEIDKRLFLSLPLIGVDIYVPDAFLFSGAAFLVLLLWLRHSLFRQLQNLRASFARAEEMGQLPLAYRWLAMTQVLTMPKPEAIEVSAAGSPSPIPAAMLILIAAIAQVAVTIFDVATFVHMWQLTDYRLRLIMLALCEGALLALILYQTVRSWQLNQAIAGTWASAREKLDRPKS